MTFARRVVGAKTSSRKSPLLWHPSGSPRQQYLICPQSTCQCVPDPGTCCLTCWHIKLNTRLTRLFQGRPGHATMEPAGHTWLLPSSLALVCLLAGQGWKFSYVMLFSLHQISRDILENPPGPKATRRKLNLWWSSFKLSLFVLPAYQSQD